MVRREHCEVDSPFLGVNATLLLVLSNIFIFASVRRLLVGIGPVRELGDRLLALTLVLQGG